MGKTKYKKDWENKFSWVKKCSTDQYKAICTVCGDSLTISSGVNILERHGITPKHVGNMKNHATQSTFNRNAEGQVLLQVPDKVSVQLTTEEQVLKAEIVRCLDMVHNNLPFAAADGDNDKYRLMFPDSQIAKAYMQKENKAKYMIQFGIAPVIRDIILDDLRGKPYSFRFDETTTSQIKKQYDGYATFFSDHLQQVITTYLGTLFVGKCSAQDILQDLEVLMEGLQIDLKLMLSLGMDGPNVNLLFFQMLNDKFETQDKKLIDVGTCPLHTVANSLGKGLHELDENDIDLNEFAVNLHSFFKLSAKRIEQYFTSDVVTDLEPQRMIRHSETRWLGI